MESLCWRLFRRILLDLLQLLKGAALIFWLVYQDFVRWETGDWRPDRHSDWHTATTSSSPHCCKLKRGPGARAAGLGCCCGYDSVCLKRDCKQSCQLSKTCAASTLHQNSTFMPVVNKQQQNLASTLYSVLWTSNYDHVLLTECQEVEATCSSDLDLDWGLDLDRNGIKFIFALCWIILLLFVQCSAPAYHRQMLPVSETKTTHYSNFVEFPRHIRGRMFEQSKKPTEIGIRKLKESILKVLHHFLPYPRAVRKTVPSSHAPVVLTPRSTDSKIIEVPLHGSPNKGYCAKITIGLDKVQEFCVLIDTGSANFAVAATAHPDVNKYFNVTNVDESFRNLGTGVWVSYTEGEWSGTLASAMISIAGSEQATEAHVALIKSSENFFIRGAQWEGIMGMAYSALAKPDSSVETFWDALRKAQGMKDIFALRLCPPLDVSNSSTGQIKPEGQLTLGGRGSSGQSYTGAVFHTSIVHEEFYTVEITNISVDGIQVDIPCKEFNNDKTIVDSGTTDIYLPNKAFDAVLHAFLKHFKNYSQFDIPESFWRGNSKLAWSSNNLKFVFDNFPTVHIGFASNDNRSQEFSLAVTPQIYLRKVEGTTEDRLSTTCHPVCDFFVFGIKKRKKGTIIGGNVMLGFTTVFDREAGKIGFAKSTCQYQQQGRGSVPYITGPYSRDPVDCECHNCSQPNELVIITGSLATMTLIFIVVSVILAVKLHRRKTKRHGASADNQESSSTRWWSCCKCRNKEDHTLQANPAGPASDGARVRCFGGASTLTTWIKRVHARANFVLRQRRKSTAHNVARGSTAEVMELHAQEISDIDAEEINMQLEYQECNATDVAKIEDEAEIESGIGTGSDQDTASLLPQVQCQQPGQHSELVTGKTSYIDDSYPKLALSETPADPPQDLRPGRESSAVTAERRDTETCPEAKLHVCDSQASIEDESGSKESRDHDIALSSPVFANLNKTPWSTSVLVGVGLSHRSKITVVEMENNRQKTTKFTRLKTKQRSSNQRKHRSKEEQQNLLNNITTMLEEDYEKNLLSSSIKSTDSGLGPDEPELMEYVTDRDSESD